MQRFVSRMSVLVGVVVLVGFAASAAGQAPDPVVGTWKLNPAKSKYSPGPAPKSQTVTITPAGKGYAVAIDAVGADGQPSKWSYTSLLDGTDSAVSGNPAFDSVSTTGGGSSGTTTYKKAGKVVSTLGTLVSPDGKMLTVTTKGTDAQGRTINNVAIYDRQ